MIIQFLIGIAVLGLLVFVHEGGHFLIAKWRKVRVNTFSIGFGPAILKKKIGDTEYRISLIPFGGYVSMAGEQPGDIKGKDYEFSSKKVWERITIAFAGPFFNVLFAVFILWVGFAFIGIETSVSTGDNDGVIVGYVYDSNFEKSTDLQLGDKIVSIGGEKVTDWENMNEALIFTEGDTVSAKVKKVGAGIETVILPVIDSVFDGMPMRFIPISPRTDVFVREVKDSTPAFRAGLLKGDRIISANNVKVGSIFHLISIIDSSKAVDTINFVVERDSQLVALSPLVADEVNGNPKIGVRLNYRDTHIAKYSMIGAVVPALKKSKDIIRLTFITFQKLFTGHVQLKHMSGPVGIVKATGVVASYGMGALIFFIALISINLGLFNLLPLMVTDGGLIMFFTIEAIRGKPLPLHIQESIQQVAFLIFIGFAIFITFVDISRLM